VAIHEVITGGARDRATLLLTALLERFVPRNDWRHDDVAEIVDVLIEAAREPASAHTRAVADEIEIESLRTARRPEDPPFGRRKRDGHEDPAA
jgi:hypothetical protein